jgi:hypothetical protein
VRYRVLAEEWLRRNFAHKPEVLFMRNDNDHRPSVDVKRWQLGCLHSYDITLDQIYCAYDDHTEIVAMYRECGIQAHFTALHNTNVYDIQKQHA